MSVRVDGGPAHRYYRALVGCWSGTLVIDVTDWRAVARLPLATRVMAVLARLSGSASMATTLDADGAAFVHTTRMSRMGVTVFETAERITVHDDGRAIRLVGTQRPRIGPRESYTADGEIDDGTHAMYRIPWCGSPMVQRTSIVPAGLELTQETAWSRAFVLLRRSEPSS